MEPIQIETILNNTPEITIEDDELYAQITLHAKIKLSEYERILEIVKLQKGGVFNTTLKKK